MSYRPYDNMNLGCCGGLGALPDGALTDDQSLNFQFLQYQKGAVPTPLNPTSELALWRRAVDQGMVSDDLKGLQSLAYWRRIGTASRMKAGLYDLQAFLTHVPSGNPTTEQNSFINAVGTARSTARFYGVDADKWVAALEKEWRLTAPPAPNAATLTAVQQATEIDAAERGITSSNLTVFGGKAPTPGTALVGTGTTVATTGPTGIPYVVDGLTGKMVQDPNYRPPAPTVKPGGILAVLDTFAHASPGGSFSHDVDIDAGITDAPPSTASMGGSAGGQGNLWVVAGLAGLVFFAMPKSRRAHAYR